MPKVKPLIQRPDYSGVEKTRKEQTTIRLPVELKEQLQQEAERRGYTLTDLIAFILLEYLQNTVPK